MSEAPGYRQAVRRLLTAATLVCGTEMDGLLEQVADGDAASLNPHQRQCPYCQAALGELAVMWAPVAEMAAAPVTGTPGLDATVMSQIRQLGQEAWYSVRVTNRGVIRIAARVVTALARDSARLVPGVQVVFSRSVHGTSTGLAEHACSAGRPGLAAGPGVAAIDLTVAISSGRPARIVAGEVQRRVSANLRRALGLHAVTVNVLVADIVDED